MKRLIKILLITCLLTAQGYIYADETTEITYVDKKSGEFRSKLNVSLKSDFESIEAVIYGEEINDLKKKRQLLQRDLERIKVHLEKHFFINEVILFLLS